jgi:hypothetical protein
MRCSSLWLCLSHSRVCTAEPAHGIAGFGVAALLFVVAAPARAVLSRLATAEPSRQMIAFERQSLTGGGAVLLHVAAAYLNNALGLAGADRAWVYAGIGTAAWVAAALGGRREGLLGLFLPSGVAALALAAWLARDEPGRAR